MRLLTLLTSPCGLVCAAALVGCAATVPVTPAPAPAALQAAALPSPAAGESLPFVTALFDGAPSARWFAPGGDEQLVFEDQASLDAFYARHARLQPNAGPIPPGPLPVSPMPPADPLIGMAAPQLEPLPPAAAKVDFTKYRAIVVFDGTVPVTATTRITGVMDDGDRLRVETTRFLATGMTLPQDAGARIHLILLPRAYAKPIGFAPIVEADGRAGEGEGGGGLAGYPLMNPKWKAVPNPEVTRDRVEALFRGVLGGATPATFTVEKRKIADLLVEMPDQARSLRFTPDSEVWFCKATGELPMTMFPGGMMGRGEGGTAPTTPELVMLVPLDEPMYVAMSAKAGNPGTPGFAFMLDFGPATYLGDEFRFRVQGTPAPDAADEARIAFTLPGGKIVEKTVAYADIPGFAMKLDRANLPGLDEAAPLNKLHVEVTRKDGGGNGDLYLLRDRDTRPFPAMRAMDGAATPVEAFARDIAVSDWGGTGVAMTFRATTLGQVKIQGNAGSGLSSAAAVRVYDITGTFPKRLVPAMYSPTGEDAVVTPKRLRVTLTEAPPVRVLDQQALPE